MASLGASRPLKELLAEQLPKDVPITFYHYSTPPSKSSALFSAPPHGKSERTYCESHTLAASIVPTDAVASALPQELLVLAIEVLIYTTRNLTTIFVSKADSTGYISELHLPRSQSSSPLKAICRTFVSWLASQRQRQGKKLVVSLFARAQDQYLFPASIENKNKHVLDDRGLVKWWCRVLDPIIWEYKAEGERKPFPERLVEGEASTTNGVSPQSESTAKGYLVIPGFEPYDTLRYIPPAPIPNTPRRWATTHPLLQIAPHPAAPPRCLVPHFPDDPKARFLDELDEELPDRGTDAMVADGGTPSRSNGQWKSVKTLDQFWEFMAFRQECSSGRIVGFIWVVITPPKPSIPEEDEDQLSRQSLSQSCSQNESQESVPSPRRQKTSRRKKEAKLKYGPIPLVLPKIKSSSSNLSTSSITSTSAKLPAEDSPYWKWPESSRGTICFSLKNYDRAHEVLLQQTFANRTAAARSTSKWKEEIAVLGGMDDWGFTVVGKKEYAAAPSLSDATNGVTPTMVMGVRKKRKPNGSAEAAAVQKPAEPVQELSAGSVRKKAKTDSAQPTDASAASGINTLTSGLVLWNVCAIGFIQLFRYYWKRPQQATCVTTLEEDQVPRVTVIRPVKGLDPRLYECLAATLRQTYPKDKLNTVFCVPERSDPAFPILERLCKDFPDADVHILVEDEDPLLLKDNNALGPNPKIRNMSRAYREAKGDIVWVLDCNVWVGKGVCGRLVDLLCGFGKDSNGKSKTKYKFVHQTPLTVDLDSQDLSLKDRKELLGGRPEAAAESTTIAATSSSDPRIPSGSTIKKLLQRGGGRLDEAFMSSAHAKFYQAINTVAVAPCIMGKSTMFRRSQLNYVTSSNPQRAAGIDFFSDNICEDHLIGDVLWKQPQAFEERGYKPEAGEKKESWGKHAMLFGDFCFQPISHTSVMAYLQRRIRWLRVRKFTVTLATFVEPGTESILCGLYGAYALTTLPFFNNLGISPTWTSFFLIWLIHLCVWCLVDYIQYLLLHCAKTVEIDADTPDFILPQRSASAYHRTGVLKPLLGNKTPSEPGLLDGARRSFIDFLFAWLGREIFALPVWVTAFWGGVTVEWRGRTFWVGLDMKVHEILPKKDDKKDADKKR
ncbi:glycosyltransferase family 21 protein [Stemphylium lycopersici]|uniref:Ceramide glucosyltransferase n=1 Tax=Stemphylium lycopersici TaxID=183478 RepID=A0A364MYP2_STELY|nr:glycosyltransferase family 21 protein [Stemphylium lycopersici]RAR07357.1 glycosyltransferase family 21 protein [Stemphylium lycopersici]